MADPLVAFVFQGKKLWTVKLPGSMTTMEVIDYKSKGFKAVIVALNNCQVHIYKEKYLVNVIKTDAIVTGLKFGQFGREEGTLIMTLKGKPPLLKTEVFLCNTLKRQIM